MCGDFKTVQVLYDKYTDNYNGPITRQNLKDKETASEAAREFVRKYGSCEDYQNQVVYLSQAGPALAEKIEAARSRFASEDRRDRFDKAMKANNTAEIFSSGADLLKHEPKFIDV